MDKLIKINVHTENDHKTLFLPTDPKELNNIVDNADNFVFATMSFVPQFKEISNENIKGMITHDIKGYLQSVKKLNVMLMLDYEYFRSLNNAIKFLNDKKPKFQKYINQAENLKNEHMSNMEIANKTYNDEYATSQYNKLIAKYK